MAGGGGGTAERKEGGLPGGDTLMGTQRLSQAGQRDGRGARGCERACGQWGGAEPVTTGLGSRLAAQGAREPGVQGCGGTLGSRERGGGGGEQL